MGLFNIFKKKNTNTSAEALKNLDTTNLAQSQAGANEGKMVVSLEKSQENLGKVLVNLSKETTVDLTKHTARVALDIDYSGSMQSLYENGDVQDVITRLLPIALKFDDNGELESWIFSNGSERLSAITLSNYKNYVKKVIYKADMRMGGTNYSPVLEENINLYKEIEPSDIPAFIIFITDGSNWDEYETDEIIREISEYNMFVQFVGIGNESFDYLRKLDNLSGRKHDNTGFIAVEDMSKMNDIDLYTALLEQYTEWLAKK